MSGLFFSRFSKPTARVAHSKIALITNYENQRVFMFRMANARMNQIIEANVSVMLVMDTLSAEGVHLRKLIDLPVQRSKTPAFALSWTVIHTIDDKSPLYIAISVEEELPRVFFTRKPKNDLIDSFLYFGPFQSAKAARNLLRSLRRVVPYCTQKIRNGKKCFYTHLFYVQFCEL